MSYIQDAIMESNNLFEEDLRKEFHKKKNSPIRMREKYERSVEEKKRFRIYDIDDDDSVEYVNPEYHEENDKAWERKFKELKDIKPVVKESKELDIQMDDDEVITEDVGANGFVDIEQYLPKENYVESFVPLKESYKKISRMFGESKEGSPIYESNEKRRKREADYRKCANISESFVIMEDNINNWALNRTCMWHNISPERLKAELLKKPYTGLERYYED